MGESYTIEEIEDAIESTNKLYAKYTQPPLSTHRAREILIIFKDTLIGVQCHPSGIRADFGLEHSIGATDEEIEELCKKEPKDNDYNSISPECLPLSIGGIEFEKPEGENPFTPEYKEQFFDSDDDWKDIDVPISPTKAKKGCKEWEE